MRGQRGLARRPSSPVQNRHGARVGVELHRLRPLVSSRRDHHRTARVTDSLRTTSPGWVDSPPRSWYTQSRGDDHDPTHYPRRWPCPISPCAVVGCNSPHPGLSGVGSKVRRGNRPDGPRHVRPVRDVTRGIDSNPKLWYGTNTNKGGSHGSLSFLRRRSRRLCRGCSFLALEGFGFVGDSAGLPSRSPELVRLVALVTRCR